MNRAEKVQFILGCIPVDCDRNRAYATTLGIGSIPIPPPYKDSVQDSCPACGGPMWVGPELRAKRLKIMHAGEVPLLLCLICATLYQKATGQDLKITPLSGKRSERGD